MADTNTGGNLDHAMENSVEHEGHNEGNHHIPQPLIEQQREELQHRNDQVLCTPITGNTPEDIALENAWLANLAERERLERLERSIHVGLQETNRAPVRVAGRCSRRTARGTSR
ncbi:hypothetical protein D1007_04506 [Hordeum vulgare]|nr:hypothetical protein D1007_04506 [Hordeum vulgare]